MTLFTCFGFQLLCWVCHLGMAINWRIATTVLGSESNNASKEDKIKQKQHTETETVHGGKTLPSVN